MDVRDLQRLESDGDVDGLKDALAENDPRTRRQACVALGQLGGSDVLEPLLTVLQSDQEPSVRAAAAEALGWLRDRAATPRLLAAFREDRDGDVRARAATALGSVGDRSALPALEEAARACLAPSASGAIREHGHEAILALGSYLPDLEVAAVLRDLATDQGEAGRVARQALLPEIVWTSYYQDALRHLAADAGWGTSGWSVAAELRADPTNAYDQDAVAVVALAMGKTIGYLRADYASAFTAALREGVIPCTVEIRGTHRLTAYLVSLGAEPPASGSWSPEPPAIDAAVREEALALLAACAGEEMTAFCLRRLGDVSDRRDAALVTRYASDPRPRVRTAARDVLRDWGAGGATGD